MRPRLARAVYLQAEPQAHEDLSCDGSRTSAPPQSVTLGLSLTHPGRARSKDQAPERKS